MTVAIASSHVFTNMPPGTLRMMMRTMKVIRNVNTPSATAAVCKSTLIEGPPNMCLYWLGITSEIAKAPATAPAACQKTKSLLQKLLRRIWRIYPQLLISFWLQFCSKPTIFHDRCDCMHNQNVQQNSKSRKYI